MRYGLIMFRRYLVNDTKSQLVLVNCRELAGFSLLDNRFSRMYYPVVINNSVIAQL